MLINTDIKENSQSNRNKQISITSRNTHVQTKENLKDNYEVQAYKQAREHQQK